MSTKAIMDYTKVIGATLVGSVAGSAAAHYIERHSMPIDEKQNNILPHEVFEGPTPNAPALFFLHGWPDDLTMLRKFAKDLSRKYHCVNCTLPGYPTPPSFTGHPGTLPNRKWGFGFEESAIAMKATIELTCKGHMEDAGVTLVVHDWGCMISYLMVSLYHPTKLKIHRIIAMDVGVRMSGPTVAGALMVLAYQGLLNVFFALPEGLGSVLTRAECFVIGRVGHQGDKTARPQITSAMNWPYQAAWREMFTPGGAVKRVLLDFAPPMNVPFLFLYAEDRPESARFCDAKWFQSVSDTSALSHSIAMPGNHWFPNQHPEKVLQLLRDWLQESDDYRVAKL